MKLFIVAAALLLPASAAPVTAPGAAPPPIQDLPGVTERSAFPSPHPQMPNLLGNGGSECPSIARQIAEENKRDDVRQMEARTLDREPAAHLLLAVDRQVDGCREVTFVRRNVAPGGMMPNVGDPVRPDPR